jgi:hypothetical protein
MPYGAVLGSEALWVTQLLNYPSCANRPCQTRALTRARRRPACLAVLPCLHPP